MVEYIGTSVCWYVARSHVFTFLRTELTTWLGYPSSYGFTGSIESITSRMSFFSNRNSDNTRSVTLIKYFAAPKSSILIIIIIKLFFKALILALFLLIINIYFKL